MLVALGAVVLAWASFRARSGWFVAANAFVFALYTWELSRRVGSPLRPQFDLRDARVHFVDQILEAVWCLLATHLTVGIGRLGFTIDRWPAQKRQLPDILSGLVYLAGVLAFVDFVFAIPVQGLFATSGIVAIILGLALQSTLADLFSGIAVRIEGPYDVGDIICIDAFGEGTVSEINWRSTHVRSEANDITVIPNSVVAKSRLVNRTSSAMSRECFRVAFQASVAPAEGKAILAIAASTCAAIVPDPAPQIVCAEIAGDRTTFDIWFSVADRSQLRVAHDALCEAIYHHTRTARIALAGSPPETPPEP